MSFIATARRHQGWPVIIIVIIVVTAAMGVTMRPAAAQTADFPGGEAAIPRIVRGAPYSGEGQTTLTQTLGDGTRIERKVTAKFYRDGAGRIRREQQILGLEALDPAREASTIVTIVDPVAGATYTLDPMRRVAHRTPINPRSLRARTDAPPPPPPPPPPPGGAPQGAAPRAGAPPPPPPPAPPRGDEESLGTKDVAGVQAVGKRTRVTIPAGQVGNDRPIVVTKEWWESPALNLLVLSSHQDPRTGDVTFRLTNVTRGEPAASLFTVPSDYTLVDGPAAERSLR